MDKKEVVHIYNGILLRHQKEGNHANRRNVDATRGYITKGSKSERERQIPYDPAIPLLGIYPDSTIIQRDTCTPMFIAALFTIAKPWKQPECPLMDERIKKMCHIYTTEYCCCC